MTRDFKGWAPLPNRQCHVAGEGHKQLLASELDSLRTGQPQAQTHPRESRTKSSPRPGPQQGWLRESGLWPGQPSAHVRRSQSAPEPSGASPPLSCGLSRASGGGASSALIVSPDAMCSLARPQQMPWRALSCCPAGGGAGSGVTRDLPGGSCGDSDAPGGSTGQRAPRPPRQCCPHSDHVLRGDGLEPVPSLLPFPYRASERNTEY